MHKHLVGNSSSKRLGQVGWEAFRAGCGGSAAPGAPGELPPPSPLSHLPPLFPTCQDPRSPWGQPCGTKPKPAQVPDHLSMLGRAKTRPPGSLLLERRQRRAVPCRPWWSPGRVDTGNHCHLPHPAVVPAVRAVVALAFPRESSLGKREGGSGPAPCSRRFLSSLRALGFFFSLP